MKKLYVIIIVAMLCGLASCKSGISSTPDKSTPQPEAPSKTASEVPSEISKETSLQKSALEYTFDPYVLPSDAASYLGNCLPDYRKLVDAVLERQTTISLPEESLSKVYSCLIVEFPLCALINDIYIDWENSAVTISYIYSEEEHSEHIRAFTSRIEQVISSAVLPAYNDCEKVLSLYRWTANNIAYVDGNDVSAYHALMDGEGICQSYDGVFRFLLLQIGIDALNAGSFMDDGCAHQWTVVKIDDRWFHMDPTFEDSFDGGDGLTFFGMDDAAREQTGTVAPFTTGIDAWWTSAPVCNSSRFDSFNLCVYWELNADTHSLLLYYNVGNEPYAVYDTASYKVSYF
ncbi:MAG: transglutaminase-like domain-containing protein [Oscillospiraceae bacterium]|nr:transglutaminase-like domain-containing protein [Oscillospiraceae bacterium]